ncbi:MAG TPA: ABC transporter ATP-binding protein [Coxiellaceae bacterium]|nr:ABC transporter ATP-binding protein [Coxiellaceae bacterium]
MANALIELQNVSKLYTMGEVLVYALNRINLTIQANEYVAILGPSGSGKSTLMNIIGCLDTPSEGEYWLNGQEVSHLNRRALAHIRNREIGFVFQSFNLLEYVSSLENVALPLVYQGVGRAERHERAKQLLTQLGLSDRLDHRPNELSGGQRQRVAIARALATQPTIILADEPTGNLDSRSGQEVIEIFESLHTQGKTLILVTHDTTLAKRASRIIQMRDGSIVSQNRENASPKQDDDTITNR